MRHTPRRPRSAGVPGATNTELGTQPFHVKRCITNRKAEPPADWLPAVRRHGVPQSQACAEVPGPLVGTLREPPSSFELGQFRLREPRPAIRSPPHPVLTGQDGQPTPGVRHPQARGQAVQGRSDSDRRLCQLAGSEQGLLHSPSARCLRWPAGRAEPPAEGSLPASCRSVPAKACHVPIEPWIWTAAQRTSSHDSTHVMTSSALRRKRSYATQRRDSALNPAMAHRFT